MQVGHVEQVLGCRTQGGCELLYPRDADGVPISVAPFGDRALVNAALFGESSQARASLVDADGEALWELWSGNTQWLRCVRVHPDTLPLSVRSNPYSRLVMSGSTRTPRVRLHAYLGSAPATREQLCVTVTSQLREFLNAAHQAGLDTSLAVRLGLERALLLADSGDLRMGVERARRALNSASANPRATLALAAEQAAYVRQLYNTAPQPEHIPIGELRVDLPEELLSRARDAVGETALHAGAVIEMLAWERAARLQGRTMLEWGLKTLAIAVAAG
jgi:hypothetical protein